jgi:signal transduction histidine kinase
VEVAEDLPPVDTDSALVSKIIGNLLSNAIKYTPSGGRIWLRASARPGRDGPETGPWVVAEVRDTGPGVPAALREQVFDEFFRAPTATVTARGEGIGLAVSRRVARLLGGEITLDSEEGRGAAFTLWLPVQSSDAARLELSPPLGRRPSRTDGERNAAENVRSTPDGRRGGAPPTRLTAVAYDRRRTVQ